MEGLIVLDVMGYIFRAYHAIGAMTNERGESTQALFGFIRSVQRLYKEFDCKHIVAVFDGPGNAMSRKKLYPEYKANRAETPQDLYKQFSWAETFCKAKGISMLSLEGVEADDTMASLAVWAKKQHLPVYLFSTDKDLTQLVQEGVTLIHPFKNFQRMGTQEVVEKYGVQPEQMADFLALVGDTSDNVPGVPGIGPKGAKELLTTYGTLEEVLANSQQIRGKKGVTLQENAELARLSKQLVVLHQALPIPQEMSFYQTKSEATEELKALYQEVGFYSLLKELQPAPVLQKTTCTLIETLEQLDEALKELEKDPAPLCIDTETTGEDPLQASLVGIGFGKTEETVWYLPATLEGHHERLAPFLAKQKLVGQNIKYDLHVLQKAGYKPLSIAFDTMLASYVLQAEERQHGLDVLALKEFDQHLTPITELIGKGKKQITMDKVDVHLVKEYCGEDVSVTLKLKNLYQERLKARGLTELFEKMELPLVPVLLDMEARGVFVDSAVLERLQTEVAGKLEVLQEELFSLAGTTWNLNSPKQLGEVLFENLGLTPPKKTKTGYSTSAEVLEQLKHKHPVVEKVLEWRGIEKLRSTYIEALPKQIHLQTGRIHCTFNQMVTATGRLSSQNPNLQNIPIRSPLGQEVRKAFCPEKEGWSYLSADYSQIELRLLAHFSEDTSLIEAFREGKDIHRATAAKVYGVAEESVTSEMRRKAKAVNFGILYGQTAFGLSQELGIGRKEAQEFIDRYKETYPSVQAFMDRAIFEAEQHKMTKTLFGRERKLEEIQNKNPLIQQAAKRLAINTPLQGTAADLIKLAMIHVHEAIKDKLGFMILQIHDELLFEVPDQELTWFEEVVRQKMEEVASLKVPLVVDVGIGKNWKEC